MFQSNKADIVHLLEAEVPAKHDVCPSVDSQVLDRPAMVHRLAPTTQVYMEEYIHEKIFVYLLQLLL